MAKDSDLATLAATAETVPSTQLKLDLDQVAEAWKHQPEAMVYSPIGLDGVSLSDGEQPGMNRRDHERGRVHQRKPWVERRGPGSSRAVIHSERQTQAAGSRDGGTFAIAKVLPFHLEENGIGAVNTHHMKVTRKKGEFEVGEASPGRWP